MDKRERERLEQMTENIPKLWNARTMLYIGANKDRFHYASILEAMRIKTDVLEIGEENCGHLKTIPWLNKVICGDVRNVLDLPLLLPYDLLLWNHGPNMIPLGDLQKLLPKLDKVGKLIVLNSNWGREYIYHGNTPDLPDYMNAVHGNEIDDFPGFTVKTLGEKNEPGNNLLAWRYSNV